MKHWVLALYILSYSTGVANGALCFLAWLKTRDGALKAFLLLLAVFVGQLLLANLAYFVNAYLGTRRFEEGLLYFSAQAVLMTGFTLAGAQFTHSLTTDSVSPWRDRVFIALSLVPLVLLGVEAVRSIMAGGEPTDHRWAGVFLQLLREGFVVYATVYFWTRLNRARNSFFRSLMRLVIVLDIVWVPLSLFALFWNSHTELSLRPLSVENLYFFLGSLVSAGAVGWNYFLKPSQAPEIPAPAVSTDLGAGDLSDRERAVVDLVSQGLSNKEIADRLFLSPATVKNHLYRIFQKTGARSRVDLLRLLSRPPG